jgi:hypothetical protein
MSKSDEGIRCRCGHRLRRRDLVQIMMGVVDDTPAFVFVRYRCPRCHRAELQHVNPQDLTACLFGPEEPVAEPSDEPGPIGVDEVIDFYEALENLTPADLAALTEADSFDEIKA